jgi:hypothetical protein
MDDKDLPVKIKQLIKDLLSNAEIWQERFSVYLTQINNEQQAWIEYNKIEWDTVLLKDRDFYILNINNSHLTQNNFGIGIYQIAGENNNVMYYLKGTIVDLNYPFNGKIKCRDYMYLINN